ncbi:MAG: hypothetical protein L3J73_03865, partial [Thermoplasmata archaeon]|nr:hypothetical protein [Thermoplasmata archaeon]
VNPTFPEEGKPLTLTASVFGGSTGPFTYSWSGLPTGCGSSNTAQLVCTPSEVGQFQVVATVTTPQGDFGAGMATVPVTLNPSNVVSGVLWFFALVVILAVAGSAVFLYFIYRVITDADRSNRRWTPPPPNWPNYGPPVPMPPPPPTTFPPPPPPSPPLR